ncbi:MAG: hypothetical protein AB7K09_15205 [Planctomycetota bacterium]
MFRTPTAAIYLVILACLMVQPRVALARDASPPPESTAIVDAFMTALRQSNAAAAEQCAAPAVRPAFVVAFGLPASADAIGVKEWAIISARLDVPGRVIAAVRWTATLDLAALEGANVTQQIALRRLVGCGVLRMELQEDAGVWHLATAPRAFAETDVAGSPVEAVAAVVSAIHCQSPSGYLAALTPDVRRMVREHAEDAEFVRAVRMECWQLRRVECEWSGDWQAVVGWSASFDRATFVRSRAAAVARQCEVDGLNRDEARKKVRLAREDAERLAASAEQALTAESTLVRVHCESGVWGVNHIEPAPAALLAGTVEEEIRATALVLLRAVSASDATITLAMIEPGARDGATGVLARALRISAFSVQHQVTVDGDTARVRVRWRADVDADQWLHEALRKLATDMAHAGLDDRQIAGLLAIASPALTNRADELHRRAAAPAGCLHLRRAGGCWHVTDVTFEE